MRNITKKCGYCNSEFQALLKEIKRGGGKYCCKLCANKAIAAKRKPLPSNCICTWCEKDFRIKEHRRKRSKSGLNFCSRNCKDEAQRIDNNIKEIQPSHYKDGSSVYRDRALKYYGNKCRSCNYNKNINILQVHHIDGNRKNNRISNLEVLCPNCHITLHMELSSNWNRKPDFQSG